MIDTKTRLPGVPPQARRQVLETFFGNFRELRPIQDAAYAPILRGSDVVVCSGTGSGKTEAAIAPLIDRLLEHLVSASGVVILYLCPTKALINDLKQRLEPRCQRLGVEVAYRHGDQPVLSDRRQAGILITTPESLDVLLCRGDGLLSGVRAAVIDEAHLFYNTQRGLQLRLLIHRLERRVSKPVQLVAMSATINSPDNLVQFLFDKGRVFETLQDHTGKPLEARVQILQREDEVAPVVQGLLAGEAKKLLIFANSRRECDSLGSVLRDVNGLRDAVHVHHSSLAAPLREEVERQFSRQQRAVCVATSTLELGIDIGDVDAVVLYGAASSHESFLQRIGRGSRRANQTTVICLVPPTRRPLLQALIHLATVNRVVEGSVASESPFTLFGAAVQQLLSYLHERDGAFVRVADFVEAVGAAGHLTRPTLEAILSQLAADGVVKHHGFKNAYGADDGFHRLESLRFLYGNYPAAAPHVPIHEQGREIGRIHAVNLLRLGPGTRFRFAGRVFSILSVSRTMIEVRSARTGVAIDLIYPGGSPGVHPAVLSDVVDLIASGNIPADALSTEDGAWVTSRVSKLRPFFEMDELPFLRTGTGFAHLTFAGTLLNRAIAVSTSTAPTLSDDLCVVTDAPLQSAQLPEAEGYETVLSSVMDSSDQASLFQALLPASLRLREVREALVKTPAHNVSLARLRRASPRLVAATELEGLI